ncbi:unnamed protein product [Prorocentrum cordatum]|uniref:Uncharacterized protein n=1 Tax=Prorocentrum cordatum TaxID=2364126 RepID=A0ABN9W3Q8_9DINO|nr:unnamed protein product [Polarella glacialis]
MPGRQHARLQPMQLLLFPDMRGDFGAVKTGGWRLGVPEVRQAICRSPGALGRALRRSRGGAAPSAAGHRTGHLWRTAEMVWCRRCGRHVVRRLAKLREECPGRPTQQWQLANLKAGRVPKARTTDPPIGRPAPLMEAEWDAWGSRDPAPAAAAGRSS